MVNWSANLISVQLKKVKSINWRRNVSLFIFFVNWKWKLL